MNNTFDGKFSEENNLFKSKDFKIETKFNDKNQHRRNYSSQYEVKSGIQHKKI